MGTCELSEGSIVAVSLGGVQQSGSDEAVSFSGRVVRVGGQQRNLVAVEVLGQQPPFLRAPELVGRHPSILAVKDELLKIAHYDINVLIQGETGTGKNVVAEAIHRHSRRADAPFVRVNCPSIPPGLVESELFGHEKGAFTDARTARPGLFRLASRGTLLLDEVSVVPPAVQAKLLQAIEQKAFMPVGGSELVEVGTRIIATTNENLQTRMEQGLFREDLFHRLNEAPIRLPALRDRQSDIALLAEYFLHKYAAEFGKPYQPPDQGTMEMLLVYPWPGNVRELSNCLRYGVVTGTFRPPVEMARAETKGAGASLAGAEDRDAPVAPLREAREHAVAEAERAAIINALKACRYNKSRAASRLGVSYRTLLRKISRYHIAD
jgi:DNA-binding NtrC family response regulator